MKNKFKFSWRKSIAFLVMAGALGGIFLVGNYFYLQKYSEDYIYSDLESLPNKEVAIVLGTAPVTRGGLVNLFYKYRIEAACDLYDSEKVNYFLVSGDNSKDDYNEPEYMKEDMIECGIPEDFITLDYAGFRTLDSMVRAKEVFGQDKLIVVSQEFHNERAIFIGRSKGLDVVGFNAKHPGWKVSPKVLMREFLARFLMVYDLFVGDTQPKFLGEEVEIGN